MITPFHGEVNPDSQSPSNIPQVTQKKVSEVGFEPRFFCVLYTVWHLGVPEAGHDPSRVADVSWLQAQKTSDKERGA